MNIPILVVCDELQEYVNGLVTLFQKRMNYLFKYMDLQRKKN